jgi:hypothetical protein
MIQDLHDPRNQGPNFDARTFPIAHLVASSIDGDVVIGASAEDIEDAKVIANERWAKAWGPGLCDRE